MPIFNYKCKNCGYIWESLEISHQSVKSYGCPHCGSTEVERQSVNKIGIKFNGDGWGKDGYSKKEGDKKK